MGRKKLKPSDEPKKGPKPEAADSGRFAYDGLDRTIHEKARLGILTSLVSHPSGLQFTDLKELCALTDGNLSRHLQILQEAGLVEVWKRFQLKRPQTLCRLTDEGRQRLLAYIGELERVVADAAAAQRVAAAEPGTASKPARQSPARVPPRRPLTGWSPA